MVTPTTAQMTDLLYRAGGTVEYFPGSVEQVIEIGIRDQTENLTSSFCDWFEKHCNFIPHAGTRKFLLSHMRPANFAELYNPQAAKPEPKSTSSSKTQLQTKFTETVIERMHVTADVSTSEIYPDFAQKAVELADEEQWPQDLMVEIEKGTGILLISYTTTGSASRVTKKVTPRRLGLLLSKQRRS